MPTSLLFLCHLAHTYTLPQHTCNTMISGEPDVFAYIYIYILNFSLLILINFNFHHRTVPQRLTNEWTIQILDIITLRNNENVFSIETGELPIKVIINRIIKVHLCVCVVVGLCDVTGAYEALCSVNSNIPSARYFGNSFLQSEY